MAAAGETLGFVGLGNIGGPMARRMASQAPGAIVFDAVPAAMTALAGHAELAASSAELGRRVRIVGVCVRDDAEVEAVVAGPEGLLAGMAAGGCILVHSTVGLDTIRRLHAVAAERGVALLDAGVTGGAVRAAEGRLVTMIGGSADAFARARVLAATFSCDVIHAGPLGTGIILKICNNVISYGFAMAASEGLGLAEAAGIDAEALRRVLIGNGNMNELVAAYLAGRAGAGLTTRVHARALAAKDLGHAAELAREVGWAGEGIEAVLRLLPGIFAD